MSNRKSPVRLKPDECSPQTGIVEQGKLFAATSINSMALTYLAVGVAFLALMHCYLIVATPSSRSWVHVLFFLDSDVNVPAWYSSMLLAVAAFLALQCSQVAKFFQIEGRWVLLGLSGLLLLMSCDEIARIHEVAPVMLARALGVSLEEGHVLEGRKWLLFGAPFVIVVLGGFFALLAGVLRRQSPSFLLLGLGFAAIIAGGVLIEASAVFIPHGMPRKVAVLFEEILEMSGTLLICASLIHWRNSVLPQSVTQ